MSQRFTRISGLTAVFSASALLAACGGTTGNADGGELTEITVPMVTVSGFGGPQFIAQDLGLWTQHGLNVQQPVSKPDATSFRQVPLQVAAGGWVLSKAQGGEDNKWLSTLQDVPVFDIYSNTTIQNPADLRGKRIGVTAQGGGPYNALLNVLESNGLTIDDVDVVHLQSTTTIYQALTSGEIDAGPLSPPTNFMAGNEEDLHKLVPFAELNPIPSVVLAAETGWLSENQEVAEGWIKGYIEAQWIYATDPETAKKSLAKHLEYDLSDAADAAMVDSVYEDYLMAHPIPIGAPSDEELSNLQSFITPDQVDFMNGDGADIVDSAIMDEILNSDFLTDLEAEYGPLP